MPVMKAMPVFHRNRRHAATPLRSSELDVPHHKLTQLIRLSREVHIAQSHSSASGRCSSLPLARRPGAELALRGKLCAEQLRVVTLDELDSLVSLLDDLECVVVLSCFFSRERDRSQRFKCIDTRMRSRTPRVRRCTSEWLTDLEAVEEEEEEESHSRSFDGDPTSDTSLLAVFFPLARSRRARTPRGTLPCPRSHSCVRGTRRRLAACQCVRVRARAWRPTAKPLARGFSCVRRGVCWGGLFRRARLCVRVRACVASFWRMCQSEGAGAAALARGPSFYWEWLRGRVEPCAEAEAKADAITQVGVVTAM